MNTTNTFELSGMVQGNPQTNQTSSGTVFIKFYLNVPKADNNPVYYELACFGDEVVKVAQGLKDGQEVLVKGRISSNSYTDRNNNRRLSTSLMVNAIYNVASAPTQGYQAQVQPQQGYNAQPQIQLTKDDLPF